MDLSLNQILTKFNIIQQSIDNSNTLTYNKNKKNLNELDQMLSNLKTVLCKVDNIYHICENKCNITYNLRPSIKLYSQNYKNSLINKKVSPKISVKTISVNSIDDIPDTPLYWINNINQFGININGVLFRGNIGNVFNKSHIQFGDKISQTIICKYGNMCKTLLYGKLCKFYHDPYDLLKMYKSNIISEKTYNLYKSLCRNFTNTSWIYTTRNNNKKNINMRHFGSRNTLKYDFDSMSIEQSSSVKNSHIQNYKHQCIHDILVILGVCPVL
jgi:hypothetical protein